SFGSEATPRATERIGRGRARPTVRGKVESDGIASPGDRSGRPSAGRPSHRPAREQVDMEMVDGLSALVPRVHDDPVASIGDALLARDLGGADEELTEQERLLRAGVRERANVLDGDHQDVQGRLRIDVAERDDALVPVDDVPRDPALDDSAEQAVTGCA